MKEQINIKSKDERLISFVIIAMPFSILYTLFDQILLVIFLAYSAKKLSTLKLKVGKSKHLKLAFLLLNIFIIGVVINLIIIKPINLLPAIGLISRSVIIISSFNFNIRLKNIRYSIENAFYLMIIPTIFCDRLGIFSFLTVNSNLIGLYTLILFLLNLRLNHKNISFKVIYFLIIVVMLQSRQLIFILGSTLIIIYIINIIYDIVIKKTINQRLIKSLSLILLSIIFTIVSIFIVYTDNTERLKNRFSIITTLTPKTAADKKRLVLIYNSFEKFIEKPIMGHGSGYSTKILSESNIVKYDKSMSRFKNRDIVLHNTYLRFLVEYGLIIGLIPLYIFLLTGLFSLEYKSSNKYYFALIITILLYGLVQNLAGKLLITIIYIFNISETKRVEQASKKEDKILNNNEYKMKRL